MGSLLALQGLQGLLAGAAVHLQTGVLLEQRHGLLGGFAVLTVHGVGQIAQLPQPRLQIFHAHAAGALLQKYVMHIFRSVGGEQLLLHFAGGAAGLAHAQGVLEEAHGPGGTAAVDAVGLAAVVAQLGQPLLQFGDRVAPGALLQFGITGGFRGLLGGFGGSLGFRGGLAEFHVAFGKGQRLTVGGGVIGNVQLHALDGVGQHVFVKQAGGQVVAHAHDEALHLGIVLGKIFRHQRVGFLAHLSVAVHGDVGFLIGAQLVAGPGKGVNLSVRVVAHIIRQLLLRRILLRHFRQFRQAVEAGLRQLQHVRFRQSEHLVLAHGGVGIVLPFVFGGQIQHVPHEHRVFRVVYGGLVGGFAGGFIRAGLGGFIQRVHIPHGAVQHGQHAGQLFFHRCGGGGSVAFSNAKGHGGQRQQRRQQDAGQFLHKSTLQSQSASVSFRVPC